MGGVKKLLKTPCQPQKGPANVLEDLAGAADLVSTPEPIIVARAAVMVDKTPEEPSTSKAQSGRERKAMDESTVEKQKKKSKLDKATTTSASASRSNSVRGRSQSSPSKTSRGGKGSPKMVIPKFSIDDVPAAEPISSSTQEQSESTDADSVEDTSKKTTSRRKVAAKKAVPVKKSTRGKRGQKTEDETEENDSIASEIATTAEDVSYNVEDSRNTDVLEKSIEPEEPIQ